MRTINAAFPSVSGRFCPPGRSGAWPRSWHSARGPWAARAENSRQPATCSTLVRQERSALALPSSAGGAQCAAQRRSVGQRAEEERWAALCLPKGQGRWGGSAEGPVTAGRRASAAGGTRSAPPNARCRGRWVRAGAGPGDGGLEGWGWRRRGQGRGLVCGGGGGGAGSRWRAGGRWRQAQG